jgi:hypothetical protein
MSVYEDFLTYLWQFKAFNRLGLKTVDGSPLTIINVGYLNKDAGPDFQDVSIQIGDTKWVGSVEIHVKASDWERHGHTGDKAYNNVILHVVYENDALVFRPDGTPIPALELKPYINQETEDRYRSLVQNLNWIPCEKHIAEIDHLPMESWLLRMLIERMELKSAQLIALVEELKGSWDDAFYISLARNFGFKTNALPFELMARSLPQQLLAKHKNSARQIDALLFGQAGFLEDDFDDEYPQHLKTEYQFLKAKYRLQPIEKHLWKFLRLRPQNFPTLRLAQFSALVVKSSHLFSKVLEISDPKKIAKLFTGLTLHPYWSAHYRFDTTTQAVSTQLGISSIHNILLNSVAVTLFAYGQYTDNEEFRERSIKILETIPFEDNQITRKFVDIGVRRGNSDRSQALLHLKKVYCDSKKCLSCAIGTKIVNPN